MAANSVNRDGTPFAELPSGFGRLQDQAQVEIAKWSVSLPWCRRRLTTRRGLSGAAANRETEPPAHGKAYLPTTATTAPIVSSAKPAWAQRRRPVPAAFAGWAPAPLREPSGLRSELPAVSALRPLEWSRH